MVDQARRKGLGYLAAVLLSQIVVFLGFWGQTLYPGTGGVNLQFVIAITLTFEIVSMYFVFRLYQLRYTA